MNELTGLTKDGWTKFAIAVFNPNSDMHRRILRLVECLKKTTQEEAAKIWKRYMSKDKVPDGVTVVNLTPGDGPFLLAHPIDKHEKLKGFFVDVQEWQQCNDEDDAEQNHWSERGQTTSDANSQTPGRPRRSVLSLGIQFEFNRTGRMNVSEL